jgi:RimJ/RimL family protein N-acetyltransferase
MSNPTFQFTFKPAQESQRELIHTWLRQDYIAKWIHGTGLQNTLSGLEEFFQYLAKGKSLGRQMQITQHWIGYDGDRPFVYLLTSNVIKNENSDYAKHSETDGPVITLDIFLGDPEYLGKGLATQLIKEFLLSECSDVKEVFIDPEQNNARATHVYEKVGFKKVGGFIATWHPVPHHIMMLNMDDLRQYET